jgi:ribosomal protein S18 acetylase RimI-like enzyme
VIRPYKDIDFEDVKFLNDISYERPCTESVLRSKLQNAWIAEIGGEVIGAAICCPDSDAVAELDRSRTLLWSITVAPAQRNKGWGSVLIREVSKHFLALYLYVDTDSPAKRLYEREGFKVEKFLFNHYGRNSHAYLMRKACLIG